MENLSHFPRLEAALVALLAPPPRPSDLAWRVQLPRLFGSLVTLREPRPTDAADMLASVGPENVSRLITPPPTSVEGFERFIDWSCLQRSEGQSVVFIVTRHGSDAAIGLFQVRSLGVGFEQAEWGFALASPFWGSGIFADGAELVLNFTFDVLGTHRLEARAATTNDRGNGALRKLGARQEGVLRRSFLRNGTYLDQVLWTIFADEWRGVPDLAKSLLVH